jgi:nicotinate-nucleotide adenylyltransferase
MLLSERLGVMGGTFDPIHCGHLIAAQEALERFDLEKIIFMPANVQPLKPQGESLPAEDRYRMVAAAVEGNPRFELSHLELSRPGPSYTIDTLREVRASLPEVEEIYFIVGTDSILDICSWKDSEALMEEFPIIVATRPGYDLGRLEAALPECERARRKTEPRVHVMEIPALDVSSTELRQRVAEGRSIRYLVPEGVRHLIEQNGYYAGRL